MSGGTGRTGLTIVGQVVGSYFGPIGAAIGGAIGSYIGGELWPEQIEGPKLEGLQITSSAYGGPIPDIYGAVRVGGNIVWASPIRTVANTERQGKGGGPEVTTYRAYVDFALALSAGPITGIRKIWADQKLTYDLGDTSDIASIQASFIKGGLGMRFYPGSSTQMPDPTYEAALGVGNADAFRDVAYIMYTNFDLTEYGNRVPNITAEVISAPETVGIRRLFGINVPEIVADGSSGGGQHRITSVEAELFLISDGDERRSYVMTPNGTDALDMAYGVMPEQWPINHKGTPGLEGFETLLLWPLPTPEEIADEADGGVPIYALLPSVNNTATILSQTSIEAFDGTNHTSTLTDGDNYIHSIVPCVDREHVFAFYALADAVGTNPTYWVLWHFDKDAAEFTELRRGNIAASTTVLRASGAMSSRDGGVPIYTGGMMERDLEHVWIATGFGAAIQCFEIDPSTDELSLIDEVNYGLPTPTSTPTSVYADGACAWVCTYDNIYGFTRSAGFDSFVPLSDVVSDICVKAGLTTGDIDVTDLESTDVRGYIRTPRMSARAAIEPLMTAYAFDAVESDQKIKFRRRNATSVVTMVADDLGASESIDTSIPLVETERTQESELPQAIDLSYMAPLNDYLIGTQRDSRIATTSVDQQSIRLALALEDQEAAEIVARMLYEIWVGRNIRKWSTSVKYAKYEPTDVVSPEGENATYVARVIDKRERGNLIDWTGLDVDAAAFNPTITAQATPTSTQVVRLPTLMYAFAADLPPLRDAHFGSTGYYGAGAGYSSGWPGGGIFRQPQGGSEYVAELQVNTAATIGGARAALPAWGDVVDGGYMYRGYYPDLVNRIEIAMISGTLSSVTHDQFMNLEQVALLGDEIIAFRDATLVSGNVYLISCLLRGLRGTEWFAATAGDDAHQVGDRFIVLDATYMQRFYPASSTASVAGSIKGVTSGSSLASAGIKPLPQTWASIVPPHPVHLQAYKTGATELTIHFSPRYYVDGGWESGHDVILDPTHQEYIVHIENPADPTIEADFVVSGTSPFVIDDPEIATVLDGGTDLWVLAAATPKQFPGLGALAILGNPAVTHRHWSRQLAVSWV